MTNENFELDEQISRMINVGESVIWYGRPQKKCYVLDAVIKMLPIAILWILFDSAFISMMIASKAFTQVPYLAIIIIPFFLLHLTPVWLWIANIVKAVGGFKNITYVLTTDRIIIKTGFIGTDIRTVLLDEVDSVNMKEQVLDKLLHTGDIIITGKMVTLDIIDIENSESVYNIFQSQLAVVKTHQYHQDKEA